jgi:pimeloyl-ACP methyl ester carboxylesterase
MRELAQQVVPLITGPQALPEGRTLAEHVMSQISPITYRRALEALVTFDRQATLAHIHVPTLLLCGALDAVAPPAVMRQMAQTIIGSRFHEIANVGQLPQLEDPDTFDGLVLQFLADAQRLQ